MEAMQARLDKVDPEKATLEDVLKVEKELNGVCDRQDALESAVDKKLDDLEDLRKRLKDLLGRLRADARHGAMRRMRDTGNHLEELERTLQHTKNLTALTDKEVEFLSDEFADKEKTDEVGAFKGELGKTKAENGRLEGLKDKFKEVLGRE